MKKRLLSCVLMLSLIICMSIQPALGTENNFFTVDKNTVKVGDTVQVSFSWPKDLTISAYDLKVTFDKNAFEAKEINSTTTKKNTPPTVSSINQAGEISLGYTDSSNDANTSMSENENIFTVEFTAKKSGSYSFTISSYTVGGAYDEQTYNAKDITPTDAEIGQKTLTIQVNQELSTAALTGVTAPAKGATPVSSVTAPEGTTATIKWFSVDGSTDTELTSGNFAGDTQYKAVINVKPDTNYQFASSMSFTVDSATDWTAAKQSDGSYKLTKTFDKTAAKDTPYVATAPTVTGTITYGDAVNNNTLNTASAVVQKSRTDTTTVDGSWAWKSDSYGNAGTHDLIAVFTPEDQANYSSVEKPISVTIQPKNLGSGVTIGGISSVPTYDGQEQKPKVTLNITPEVKSSLGLYELQENKDYTVTYTDNVNAGNSATAKITPKDGSNYTFTEATMKFSINKATASTELKNQLKSALKALDETYNGSPQATLTKGTLPTDWTAKYKDNEYGDYGDSIPTMTNAGEKPIYVQFTNSNYKDEVETTYKAKIAKKNIAGADITLRDATPTYDGTNQAVEVTEVKVKKDNTSEDKLTLATDDYTVSGNQKKAAGTYTLTITAAENSNYTGSATKNWTIKQKAPTAADFDVPSLSALTYNGSPQSVKAPAAKNEIEGMGAVTVWYEGASGTTYTKSKDAPTNAGTYTVTFNVATGDNYTAATDLNYGTLTISQATMDNLTVDVKSPQTAVKRIGDFTEPTFKIGDNNPVSGSLTYSGNIGGSFSGESYDTVKGKLAVAEKDKDYTLKYSFTPNDTSNFNTASPKTGDITVTVKDIEFKVGEDTATASNAINSLTDDTTYGKTWAQRISLKTIAANVDTVSKEGTYTIVPDSGNLTDRPAVGTQNYKVKFTSTDNAYQDVEVFSGSITVTARPVTINGISAQNKVYDGNPTATATGIATAKVNGVLDGDAVTITAGTATFADKNVGTAKEVTFTDYSLGGASAGNYSLSAQPAKVTANITAKEVTLTGGISATTRAYTVGDRTVALTKGEATFTGLADGESLDITIPATGTVENANVGTGKTVTYSGVALADKGECKASNYTLASTLPAVTVNITKATAPTLATQAKSVKVGVTEQQSVDLSKLMPSDAGELTYTLGTATDNDSILETGEETRAAVSTDGLYTFTLKSSAAAKQSATVPVTIGSKNYADATATINISVVSKDVPVVTVNDITVTYNGSAVSKASITGTATIGENTTVEGSFDWATGVTAPTNVADSKGYNVTFTPTDTSNYEAVTKAIQVTINQATVSGTPSFNKVSEAGKKLSDVTPTDFTSLTPSEGTFAWNDGENTEVVQGTSYGWIFTPSNANYATLTGNVTPWAKSSYSGGGGGAAIIVQKPVISNGDNGSYTLSTDGTTATFTPNAGYEFDKVTVNGKEVTLKDGKLTGLKTGDKVEVTYKQTTDAADKQISEVKEKVAALSLKARSSKTAKKNVKVVASLSAEAKAAISDIQNLGYTVKYKFYRSTKKASGYKAMLTSTSGKYTNTIGKKGTMYYYKLRVMVYDANGNLVTQSALKQCKYANRLWTK